ncbi:hypothetical protein WJX81_005444 [Elliptochloris bilobata]|uniref:Uncharacterized protein n=1 Tax=Elliptochloris bilobata TaxID=381761 RepID=A0AAW1SE70_9CHLO
METHIYIPVAGLSDEVVAVPLSELPAEAEDLLDILKAEEAPLSVWLDFAKAYLAQGQMKQYLHILREGTGPEVKEFFGDRDKFEQVHIHCALAAYHTAAGRTERDREARSRHFQQARGLLSAARLIAHDEQLVLLGLGQLSLAEGNLVAAKQEFERATKLQSNGCVNIAGYLALANLLFRQGAYKEALAAYTRGLRAHPGAPAEVRLGLAACHFRLGRLPAAHAAFQRVLELSPGCAEALLGLAVIAFAGPDPERGAREGLDLLCRAYGADAGHPGVLALLAQCSLARGDAGRASTLASAAAEAADADDARAEALSLQARLRNTITGVQQARARHAAARAHHAAGRLADAYRCYQQASKLDARLPLPLLGMAQMNLLQKEFTNAASLLETALQRVPGWVDALKVLGALYPQAERKGQAAVAHFRAATEAGSASGEVWEMFGELLAATEPAEALKAYKRALSLQREAAEAEANRRKKAAERCAAARARAVLAPGITNGDAGKDLTLSTDEAAAAAEAAEVPPEPLPAKLLNNAAVLHMRAGDTSAAFTLMKEAIEAMKGTAAGGLPAGAEITLVFNQARIREAAGELTAAAADYRGILAGLPGYVDARLRLAAIARARGDLGGAVVEAQAVLDERPEHPDAVALLGAVHLEQKDYPAAEARFMELVQAHSTKHDAYAWLGLASLNFATAPFDRKKPESVRKAEKQLPRALDAYKRVLERSEGNAFAANGIGAVLAEQGHLGAARAVFAQVQEAAAASEGWLRLPDAALNMASVCLAQGQPVPAIQQYTSALRRFSHGTDARALRYLARACYDDGRHAAARRTLLGATHMFPSDHTLRFNTGLSMQEEAVRELQKKRGEGEAGKLDALSRAVGGLAQAHRFFGKLRELGVRRTGIEDRRLDSHLKFCAETHDLALKHVERARSEADIVEMRREASRRQLEAAKKEREAVEARQSALAEQAAVAKQQQARAYRERVERLKAAWKDDKATSKAVEEGDAMKVDKRRKKKAAEEAAARADDMFADEEGDVEYDPAAADDEFAAADGGEQPREVEDEEEEAEFDEAAFDEEEHERRILAGTGLQSSDEEEAAGSPPSGPANGGLPPQCPPGGSGGRLKRHRDEHAGRANGSLVEDDDVDEPGGTTAGDVLEDDGEDAGAGAAKRARTALLDSDEENEPPTAPPEKGPPRDAAVEGVEFDAQPGDDAQALHAVGATPQDLFGSDDDD